MNEALRRLLNLPVEGSTMAREIDALHYFVILVTMSGAVAVSAVAGYFLFKYREESGLRGSGAPADRSGYSKGGMPVWAEVGVVAGLLSLFVGWWVVGFRQYVRLRVAPPGSMEIYVSAKQWMWQFAYPDGRRTAGVLYVPVGKPVKLVMTSRDVIHSFFVPQFRLKQDVIPGRITYAWFEADRPGRYDVFCAQYCGTNHSVMRASVVAVDQRDYERVLALPPALRPVAPSYEQPGLVGQAAPHQQFRLAEAGALVAAKRGCLKCHSTDGSAGVGPTWLGMFGSVVKLADGSEVVADGAYVTESMMDPGAKVVAGFKNIMPSFRSAVDAGETAALIEFMKSMSRDATLEHGETHENSDGAAQ